MPADRRDKILELFEVARAVAPEKRAAFLGEACREDTELRAEVESLLAHDTTSFLESAPSLPGLSAGMKLGVYELRQLIGRGGMGEVWRGHDPRLKRDVAVKVLPAIFAGDPDRVARFEREARAPSALNHPNIVTVYDIGKDGGVYWIITELVDGGTLSQRIARRAMAPSEAVELSRQIVQGLSAAHGAGIVHRDLKPGNVMVTRDGRVKILDFGLAKQSSGAGADVTDTGAIMGTAAYMSPEQVRGRALDHRSDIFSFGICLHEMLSGQRAFRGDSSAEVMHAILNQEPRELPASVPGPLGKVVDRCLEKDPARRYQSAGDIDLALASELALSPQRRKPRLLWYAGGAAAVLILGLALILWIGSPHSVPRVSGLEQLSNDGLEKSMLVSDGTRLLTQQTPGFKVYQISVRGGAPVPVPLPEHSFIGDFSPDRTEFLIGIWEPEGEAIGIVPSVGGPARRLGNIHPFGAGLFCHAAWSPDGKQVIYSTKGELRVVNRDGTGDHAVAAAVEGLVETLRWSPNGKTIRYTATFPHTTVTPLFEVQLGSALAKPTPFRTSWGAGWDACCPAWTPNGRYFVFGGIHQNDADLWLTREEPAFFPHAPQEPIALTAGAMLPSYPVFSPDGKRLFFIGTTYRNEFVRYELKSSNVASILHGISGNELEYSKDGQSVAYVSSVDSSLWRCAADGSNRLLLTLPPLQTSTPRWSPDGQTIAFAAKRGGEPTHIYLVPAVGGAVTQITHGESGQSDEHDPAWSPDGRALVFGSYTAAGGIWTIDLKSRQISKLAGTEGIWSPRWSPNGRFLAGLVSFLINRSSSVVERLVVYDLRTHRQTLIAVAPAPEAGYPSWSPDGQYLYFSTLPKDGRDCWRIRLRDRKVERVLDNSKLHLGIGWGWFRIAPDGQIVTARTIGSSEVYAYNFDAP